MTDDLTRLRDVAALWQLLSDPHPGLLTWQEQYQRAAARVAEWIEPGTIRDSSQFTRRQPDAARSAPSAGGYFFVGADPIHVGLPPGTFDTQRVTCKLPREWFPEIARIRARSAPRARSSRQRRIVLLRFFDRSAGRLYLTAGGMAIDRALVLAGDSARRYCFPRT